MNEVITTRQDSVFFCNFMNVKFIIILTEKIIGFIIIAILFVYCASICVCVCLL